MSVEKRSLAWTATTSSLLYLTTRAPSPPALATKGTAMNESNITKNRIRVAFRTDGMGSSPLFVKRSSLRISVLQATNDGLDQEKGGRRSHVWTPARTSSPFSKPCASN